VADVATNIRAVTLYRYRHAFSVIVPIFLFLLGSPTYAFRAVPMRARVSSESISSSTMVERNLKKFRAVTRSDSGLCLLSLTGSSSSSPAAYPTTSEISSNPVAAAEKDPPSLLTPLADKGLLLCDLATRHLLFDNQEESITPSELVACLKAPESMDGTEPDPESFRVR